MFDHFKWSDKLRACVTMMLTLKDIIKLKGINKILSIKEVMQIYLPLSSFLHCYISADLQRKTIMKKFLGNNNKKRIPYVIGIAGSVAVGKSTSARILQDLLNRWPEHRKVDLVTTDSFIYPNRVLKERGLMKKKGFPESYDMQSLVHFISEIKSGARKVYAPVYSHIKYDIIPNAIKIIEQPDILILEGLNVLQSKKNYLHNPHHLFISDFIDFSIYVDADENLLKKWYIDRFLKFRARAFYNPDSYFSHYAQISETEVYLMASQLWNEINSLNLKQNILPTREHARLIITKSANHSVQYIRLRI